MTHEFDPNNLSDTAVEAEIQQMNAAYEDYEKRIFESRAYHGALALSGAFVLFRSTGIEAVEQVGNWCGSLATIAIASAAVVSPEHRSLPNRIRGLIEEFKNPSASLESGTQITLSQLQRQEEAALDSRSESWFWSKWENLEY